MYTNTISDTQVREAAKACLWELNIPVNQVGYRELYIGIPRYGENPMQSFSGELYPYIAEELGISDWRAVENGIRRVIRKAWNRRDPEVWERYFPSLTEAPSNSLFIATLAERLGSW